MTDWYKVKRVLVWWKDYTPMQWPAPAGFHIPLDTEWRWLKTIMDGLELTTWDDYRINLHMPFVGFRNLYSSYITNQGSYGEYWSSSPRGDGYPNFSFLLYLSSSVSVSSSYRAHGYSIRCFKNSFELPTSSWTVINWTLWWAWIFWNQTDWIISITSDWTTWYTIQDKNLWATTVYNDWNTLSQANMWNMYQWGNNYWFPSTWNVATSSTQVNAQNYGPWNYYYSSTFITWNNDWSNVQNDNLRWWVTWPFKEYQIYPSKWKPNANTLIYLPLATNANDYSWNWNNGSTTNLTFSNNKAVFNANGTTNLYINNNSLPYYDYTLHMIIARTTNSGYQLAFRYCPSNGFDNARCYISWYGTYTEGWVIHQQTNMKVCDSGNSYNFGLIDTDTSEHLWSFVVYKDSSTVYLKCFIDGQYKYQISATYNVGSNSYLGLWNRWYNATEWLKGTMREVIMENKVWTDSEVLALAKQFWFA